MSLRGAVRTMPVEDVLDWIDRRSGCGTLTLEKGPTIHTFHFDSCYATNASSNDPAEHLGAMLRKQGLVEAQALDDAFRVQSDTGVLLGKILLMIGALSEDDLRRVLELKIRESLCDVMAWPDGEFSFEPDATSSPVSAYEVSVPLRPAIEAGRERIPRWRAIRHWIPKPGSALWAKSRAGLAAEDADLLAGIDAGSPCEQLVLDHSGLRFEVMDRLARWVESGAVVVDGRNLSRVPESAMSAEELEAAARGRAESGDRAGALDLVHQARARDSADPPDPRIAALQRELERSVFAELSRSMLTKFCVPKLLKTKSEVAALTLSDTERYLTTRIDGRWDLLSLMRIAPVREIEVLLAFKRLADRGIIVL